MLSFQNKYEYADISVHRALAVEITAEKQCRANDILLWPQVVSNEISG